MVLTHDLIRWMMREYTTNEDIDMRFMWIGKSLRDSISEKVAVAIIRSNAGPINIGVGGKDNERIAEAAYAFADAMLEARKK